MVKLRDLDCKVSDMGYFVYCNGSTDKQAFDAKLEFDITLINYKGNPNWVEPTLLKIKNCLDSDEIPEASSECDYCAYYNSRNKHENLVTTQIF